MITINNIIIIIIKHKDQIKVNYDDDNHKK